MNNFPKFKNLYERSQRIIKKKGELLERNLRFKNDALKIQADMLKELNEVEKQLPAELKEDKEILDYIAFHRNAANEIPLRVEMKSFEGDMERADRIINRKVKDIERDRRFVHDCKKYLASIEKEIEQIEKKIPSALKENPKIVEWVNKKKDVCSQMKKEIAKTEMQKLIDDEKRNVVRELNMAKDKLNKYDPKGARDYLQRARDACSKGITNNEKFYDDLDLLDEFIDEIYDGFDKFEASIIAYETKRKVDDKIYTIKSAFNSCKNNADRRIFDRAQTDYKRALDAHEDILDDEDMKTHLVWLEFLPEFNNLHKKTKDFLETKMLKDEAQNLINNVKMYRGWCDAYKHTAWKVIDALQKCKDTSKELEDPKYVDLDNVKDFFNNYFPKIAEYEKEFYAQQVKEDLKKAQGTFDTKFGNSKSYYGDGHNKTDNDMQQGLRFLDEAKMLLVDLEFDDKFQGLPELQDFIKKQEEKIKEFEEMVNKTQKELEIKKQIGTIDTLVGNAKAYFNQHDNVKAMNFMLQAEDEKEELSLHPSYGDDEKVKTYISQYETKKNEFYKELEEKIKEDELRKVEGDIHTMKLHVTSATDDEQAMRKLYALEELVFEFEIKYPDLKSKVDKYNEEINKLRDDISEKILHDEIQKEVGNLNTLIGNAKTYIKVPRCLEYLQKAEDKLEEIKMEPKFSGRKEFNEEKAKQDLEEIRNEFTSLVYKDKIRITKMAIEDFFRNSRISFDGHKFAESLENLQKTKDKIDEVLSDDDISRNEEVVKFVDDMLKKIQDYEKEIGEKIRENSIREKKSKIDTSFGNAKVYFDRHSPERSLEYLQQTKDALEDLRFDEGVHEKYFEEYDQKIAEFNKTFAEKQFKSAIKKAKENLDDLMRNANTYFTKSKEASLGFYNKASSEFSEFISDEKYKDLDDVKTFAKNYVTKMTTFKKKFEAEELKSQILKFKGNVQSNNMSVLSSIKSERYDSALGSIVKKEENLEELEVLVEKDASLKDYIEKERKVCQEQKEEIIEKSFKNDIKAKIDLIDTLIRNAKMYFERNSIDQALGFLEKIDPIIEELNEDKYLTFKMVTDFIVKHNEEIGKLKDEMNSFLFAKSIKEVKDNIERNYRIMKMYYDKHDKERSLDFLSKVKEGIEQLKENDELNVIDEMVKFSGKMEKDVETFERDFNETIRKEEIEKLIQTTKDYFGKAKTDLERTLYSRSLDNFEKAQNTFSDLKEFNNSELFEKYKKEYQQSKDDFCKEFAEKALKRDGRVLKHNIDDNLRLSKQMYENCVFDKSLEYLAKSRECISNTENKMVLELPEIKNSLKDIEMTEKDIAWKILNDKVTRVILKTKKLVEKMNVLLSRGNKKKAKTVFIDEILNEIELFVEEEMYSSFDKVVEFLKDIKEIGKKVGVKSLKQESTSATSASSGPKPSGNLFSKNLLPNQMKWKKFPVGIGIKPGLFNRVKMYNTKAGKCNSLIREYERYIASISRDLYSNFIDLPKEKEKFDYEIGTVGSIKKDVLRYLHATGEWNCITEDEAKESIVKEILEQEEKFLKDFEENLKVLKHNRLIQDNMADMKRRIIILLKKYKAGIDICNFSQCPRLVQNIREDDVYLHYDFVDEKKRVPFKTIVNIITYKPGLFPPGAWDYAIMLECAKEFQEMINEIEEMQKQFPGFPYMDLIETFKKNIKQCYFEHARHCAGHLSMWNTKERKNYWWALRKFPIARKFARTWLEQEKYTSFARKFYKIEELSKKNFPFLEEFKSEKIEKSDDDLPEEEYDYEPYTHIIPSYENEIGPYKTERHDGRRWSDLKEKYGGKIMFSSEEIKINERSDKGFKNHFVLGKDEVFGRAFFKHSPNNIAIGKDKKTGKFVFPNETISPTTKNRHNHAFHCEFLFFLSVDGEEKLNPDTVYGEFHTLGDNGGNRNAYSSQMSLDVFVSQRKNINLWRHHENMARKFDHFFTTLKPGKHTIKLELRYKLVADRENLVSQQKLYPLRSTMLSEPLSTGEFTVDVPDNWESLRVDPFPIPSCSISNHSQIENVIFEARKPGVLRVHMKGGYYVAKKHWLTGLPLLYGATYLMAKYFPPQKGVQEHVWIAECGCYTEEFKKAYLGEPSMPPCFLGGGSGNNVSPDFFPVKFFALRGVERVSEEQRNYWRKDLDENDKKWLCRDKKSELL